MFNFFQSILNKFIKPKLGFRTILATIDSVWHLAFTNLFLLAYLFAFFDGLDRFYLTAKLAWLFKIREVASFESIEMFQKGPFLALIFFSLHQLSPYVFTSFSCSAHADNLAIWSSPARSLVLQTPHKEHQLDWSAGPSSESEQI